MKIAKWNEQTKTPYDVREFGSLKAGNGQPLRDWPSYAMRGYYEYYPVELAEGEGLADEAYIKPDKIIYQRGTVIGAEAMRARAEADAAADAEAQAAEDVRAYSGELAKVLALAAVFPSVVAGMSYAQIAAAIASDMAAAQAAGNVDIYMRMDMAKDTAQVAYERVLEPAGIFGDRLWTATAMLQQQ